VSTVAASATLAFIAEQKKVTFRIYKTEFTGVAVASGTAALFGNPNVGILFFWK